VATKRDQLDSKIMSLMAYGLANKEISARLKVPLSTIQRRTRKLIESGIVSMRAEINFEMLGIKKGMIHVYLHDGNIDQIAHKVGNMDTIDSVEIHIGNSDLIANILYTDSKQLLQTISDIKKTEGVDRIMWSEEVYNIRGNNNVINNLLER
jgi:Lrp/AsnC family transcriptional regulator for asnA, asnC and gidA